MKLRNILLIPPLCVGTIMQGRSSAVFCFAILMCLVPSNAYAEDSVGIISSSDSTYDYEEYYGVLLSPLRAIDGNTSDDNYTRIITWCMYYESNLACESGESFIRLEYTLSFTQEIGYVNLTTISKTGYLSYGDPWGLEMSISVFHENGTDVLWEDDETPGYINSSTWQQNNSGPIPVRNNGTIGIEFYIKTDPFYVTERDVEIRLNEIIASPVIWGCKDVNANNFTPNATDDDDSCDYDLDNDGVLDVNEVEGCTDSTANNYSPNATDDDDSCDYDLDNDGVLDVNEVEGCTDSTANNYSPNATDDDDSCDYDLDNDGVLISMRLKVARIQSQTIIRPMQRMMMILVITTWTTMAFLMSMRLKVARIQSQTIIRPMQRMMMILVITIGR